MARIHPGPQHYRSPKQPIWRHPLKGLLFITKVNIICAIISETFPDTWRPFAKMEEGRRISVDPPFSPTPSSECVLISGGLRTA